MTMLESIQSETLKTLESSLAALSECGADRYDQVRYRYIETLVRRALGKREAVKQILKTKALEAMRDYQADFSQAKNEAEKTIEKIVLQHPESAKPLQGLFEACDFNAIKVQAKKMLRSEIRSKNNRGSIASLINLLTQEDNSSEKKMTGLAFDEFLRQQENVAAWSISDSTSGSITDGDSSRNSNFAELKSSRLFKESRIKHNTEKLFSQAIEDSPENPGPLNPQMLAIRSLTTMRDLSPQYLSRFISYLDTLLWLEATDPKSKSNSPRKNARKSKRNTGGRRTS